MKTIIVTTTKEIELKPCIKCGGEEIDIGDCGYSSFNVAYGKCLNKECKHEVKFNCGWNISEQQIAGIWNKENDIDLLIKQKENLIISNKEEIKNLKKIKRIRKL